MGAISLTAVEQVDAPPGVVFGLFGAGSGAGWVFDATCDRLTVGTAITLRAPLDGALSEPVEIHGRICQVKVGRRIDIAHDQPWRGHLVIRFDPEGTGTRVRLSASLDEHGLDWLLRRRGLSRPTTPSSTPRLGLLTSKSGSGSLFAAATDSLAQLAVDEINSDGGIRGKTVELLIGDDRTDPAIGVSEAERLVAAGCRTILVSTTSATFVAVARALAGSETLLVQAVMNEGGHEGPLCIQFGERPEDQLSLAASPMMRAAGGRRWFLAGLDYCWPQHVHRIARHILPLYGGDVVGERYAPLGTQDFSPIIESILASEADLILSTFVGADAAEFERQSHAMGLRDRCRTLAPAMDESSLARVGPDASAGIFAVAGYFEDMQYEGNIGLLARYREAFGPWAPPLSSLTEPVYEAAHMWAQSALIAGVDSPRQIAREMRRGKFDLPRGKVSLDRSSGITQRLYLAEADAARFSIREAEGRSGR